MLVVSRKSFGCPVWDVGINYLVWMIKVLYTVSRVCFPKMFLPTDILLSNGLGNLSCTSPISESHTVLRKEVRGLAADSPCRVWGCGWTPCFLYVYGGPICGLHFQKWQLACKFDIMERNLLLNCLAFTHFLFIIKIVSLCFHNSCLVWN